MRMLPSAKRQLANETGFTLAEVLVTILMMSLVVMALYSMFDMSLRVFSLGNSTVETNQNARVALDRMEREIRSAWPSDDCARPTPVEGETLPPLVSGNTTSISFRNCLSDTGSPKTISYRVNGNDLERTEDELAQTLAILGPSGDLAFEYFASGQPPGDEPTDATVLVEITLVTSDTDGSGRVQTQRLVTSAGLRNASITSE